MTAGASIGTSSGGVMQAAARTGEGGARLDRCRVSAGSLAALFLGLSFLDVATVVAVLGVVIDICACVVGLGPLV